jgi:hypothetical protein
MKLSVFDVATYGGFLTVAVVEALNEAWKTEAPLPPNLMSVLHYMPLAILIALGGMWLWRFLWFNRRALKPKRELANPSVHFPTPNWHEPLKPIVTKHFQNETVELDGKSFIDCTFEKVTFVYQGTMPAQFTNCSRPNHEGGYIFRSSNPVVQVTCGIINWLRATAGGPETVQLTLINKED